jgi:hypothetical protein
MGELADATRLQLNPADPSPSELVIASSHTIDTISESDLHGNCIFNSHRRPLTQVGRHRVGGVAHQQDHSTAKRGSIDLDEVVQQRWVGVEAINEASCVTGEPGKELLERGEAWRRRFLVYCAGNKVWPSPVLTDIHDRAAKSRKDVQNGDHGREEEAATAVVFR